MLGVYISVEGGDYEKVFEVAEEDYKWFHVVHDVLEHIAAREGEVIPAMEEITIRDQKLIFPNGVVVSIELSEVFQ